MSYRTFSDYTKGYAHVKNNTGCEDYALSYTDPQGRYQIGVICDGHSDKNCFRSAKGAQYGAESAIRVLQNFMELYLNREEGEEIDLEQAQLRIKKSIKQCWDNLAYADITQNPATEEELAPLTDQVRKLYESGKGLLNIYGATFLATAVCEDFFFAMHIGDGEMLCVDAEGNYYDPLPADEKSETGSPASLCDSDLFTRENAFRSGFFKEIPQIVLVTSDGVGDCMDQLAFKEFVYNLFVKIGTMEQKEQSAEVLNEAQAKYINSCLTYWADKGHGAEDDCSMAVIYQPRMMVPQVKLAAGQAQKLWTEVVTERNDMIRDYETRKQNICQSIDKQNQMIAVIEKQRGYTNQWIQAKEKLEELKQVLRNIETNEREKIRFYDQRLEMCREYIYRAQTMVPDTVRLIVPKELDVDYVQEDDRLERIKASRQEYLAKKEEERRAREELENARLAREQALNDYNEAMRNSVKDEDDLRLRQAQERLDEAYVNMKKKHSMQELMQAALEQLRFFGFGRWDD